MPSPLDPLQIAVACLASGCGALVQGSLGFGMALLAAPILAMVSHQLVPGPLIACGLVVSSLTAVHEWRAADLRVLPLVLPGLLVGSWGGTGLLYWAPARTISVVLGALVLGAVAISVSGRRVEPSRRNVLMAAVVAGFMGTTASIPGPALALVYQHAEGPRLRGTLAAIFVFSGVISLTNLSLIGRFAGPELRLAATMAPAVLLGLGLSWFVAGRVQQNLVRAAVLALSSLAGVVAIARGLS